MDELKALSILKKYMIDDLILLNKKEEAGEMIITKDEAAALLYVISSIGINASNSGSDDEAFYYRIIREMQRWEE